MLIKHRGTSVRLLLQYAASISRIFICGKNNDGCDNNIVLLWDVIQFNSSHFICQSVGWNI